MSPTEIDVPLRADSLAAALVRTLSLQSHVLLAALDESATLCAAAPWVRVPALTYPNNVGHWKSGSCRASEDAPKQAI